MRENKRECMLTILGLSIVFSSFVNSNCKYLMPKSNIKVSML